MTSELVRFGVAMEETLLADFDALVEERGVTRSELLRDLVRAEISRPRAARGVPAFASLTLVYDHHVRDLTDRLTSLQHELGDQVRATMHVHVDERYCLEVIVMRGRSDQLQRIAERILATRGVKQGGLEIVTEGAAGPLRDHVHGHTDGHDHGHAGHRSAPARKRAGRKRTGR